jgi:hypothetical protein
MKAFARKYLVGLVFAAAGMTACGGSDDAGTSSQPSTTGGAAGDSSGGATGSGGDAPGGANSTGGADTQGTGGSGATGTEEDDVPPEVVSSSPSAGDAGVAADAVLTIEFNEPMDVASVEAAFALFVGDTKVTNFATDWNDDHTVLTVNPTEDLPHTEVSDPSEPATENSFSVGVGAKDEAGNSLSTKYEATFTVLRRVTQKLSSSSSLSGSISKNTCDGTWAPAYRLAGTAVSTGRRGACSGDVEIDPGGLGPKRGFIHFALGSVPMTAQLESATFDVTVKASESADWADVVKTAKLGQVDYGETPLANLSATKLGEIFNTVLIGAELTPYFTKDGANAYNVIDLVDPILTARGTGGEDYIQFRLNGTNSSGLGEVGATVRTLTLVYLAP